MPSDLDQSLLSPHVHGEAAERTRAADWQRRAACIGHPPEWWDPPTEHTPAARRAKAICAGCPVREECLDYGMSLGTAVGIWGGMTSWDRAVYRKSGRRRDAEPKPKKKPAGASTRGRFRCATCPGTAARLRRGMCPSCYTRWSNHGRPADGPPPPASREDRAATVARAREAQHAEYEARYTEFQRLAAQGVDRDDIAAQLGVSLRTITDYERRAEVEQQEGAA